MKKITMFVEDLSDNYNVLPFYPAQKSLHQLKTQFHENAEDAFNDGTKQVLEFIEDNCSPQVVDQVNAALNGEEVNEVPIQPQYLEPPVNEMIPQGNGMMAIPVRSDINEDDITVVPDGIIINKRFLPADILMAAAKAVYQSQYDER